MCMRGGRQDSLLENDTVHMPAEKSKEWGSVGSSYLGTNPRVGVDSIDLQVPLVFLVKDPLDRYPEFSLPSLNTPAEGHSPR